jgi:hypothetical protein
VKGLQFLRRGAERPPRRKRTSSLGRLPRNGHSSPRNLRSLSSSNLLTGGGPYESKALE